MKQPLTNDANFNYFYREQHQEYQGQPFHQHLAQGPIEQRSCRDVLCILLYLLFWAGCIIVAIFAFTSGKPSLLAAPFDSTGNTLAISGNQCGISPGYTNFPYGYYKQNDVTIFACISSCPNNTLTNPSCIFGGNISNCSQFGIYPTTLIVSMCYPNQAFSGITIDLGINFLEQCMNDIQTTWPICVAVLFIAFGISIIVMLLIRLCGGCIVIGLIVIKLAALITFGGVSFAASRNQLSLPIKDDSLLAAIAYICWGLAALFIIYLICRFNTIRVAIAIIKTAAKFTQQQPQTLIVPFLMFLFTGLFFAYWGITSIYILSTGQIKDCGLSPYSCVSWNNGMRNSLILYLFGLFWNGQIAICLSQFVVGSTTVFWYFASLQPDNPRKGYVCRSFSRALTYHFGSIIFAALILCFVHILQLFLELLHSCCKQKSLTSTDALTNACSQCCITYARCCIACFERFIRFLSKNALLIASITGQGFCTSAHQAFYLIMRSTGQYAVTHGLGHMIMWLGKLTITVLSTFCGYLLITHIDAYSTQIYSPFMPILFFVVISLIVAHFFMDVFGISADTLLLGYCLEMDILKGKAIACPPALKQLLQYK